MGLAYYAGAALTVSRANLRLRRERNFSGGFFSGHTIHETPDEPVAKADWLIIHSVFFQKLEGLAWRDAMLVM